MDWFGLSLLLAGMVSVLVGRQVLTVGAAKTSVDAASALRERHLALRKWTVPVLLVLLLGLKSWPILQAGVLMLLFLAGAGWSYRTAHILAIPTHYKRSIALSSVLGFAAIGGYFAVLLIRHVTAA
jgi:hypothetical protein